MCCSAKHCHAREGVGKGTAGIQLHTGYLFRAVTNWAGRPRRSEVLWFCDVGFRGPHLEVLCFELVDCLCSFFDANYPAIRVYISVVALTCTSLCHLACGAVQVAHEPQPSCPKTVALSGYTPSAPSFNSYLF